MVRYYQLFQENMVMPHLAIYSSDASKIYFKMKNYIKIKKSLLLLPDQQAKNSHFKSSNQFWYQLPHKAGKLLAYFFILIIQLLRPLLGPGQVCPFTIGCTEYAYYQLESKPLGPALYNIFTRLISCNPITNLLKS